MFSFQVIPPERPGMTRVPGELATIRAARQKVERTQIRSLR
jgi:hypothetical protein